MTANRSALIKVYLRNAGGACFEYAINAETEDELNVKVREHLGQIAAGGYRHCSKGILEWFPPHWIDKVKILGDVTTNYPDKPSGT